MENALVAPLAFQYELVAMNKRVQGYKFFGAISVDFWRLWIDDSKDQ